MKIKTAILFSILSLGLASHLQAATVIWDCFSAVDSTDLDGNPGVNILYYGRATPEAPFSYNYTGRLITSATPQPLLTNVGNSAAYWVIASYGDILTSFSDYQSKELLMNTGYPDGQSYVAGSSILTSTYGTSYYIALIGQHNEYDYITDTDFIQTWYGWIEIEANHDGLSVVSSALSYDSPLIVGGGAIPEPSSGLLMLIGIAALSIRRQRQKLG